MTIDKGGMALTKGNMVLNMGGEHGRKGEHTRVNQWQSCI